MLVSDNYANARRTIHARCEHPLAPERTVGMTRRATLTTLAVLIVAGALTFALYAKTASASTAGIISVAGDVRVDEDVVRAPSITYPTPDYTVGIPTPSTAAPKKRASGAPVVASRGPVVSGYLTEVPVALGAHVTKGEVVARLATAMLDLGVRQAETARAKAHANLDVLDHTIDTLATAHDKVITARSQLVTARASLVATIGALTRTRAGLETSIAVIQRLIAQSPPAGPPHMPPYPVLLAGMQQGLAGLEQGLAGATTGLAKMNQGLAKMAAGLAQLDTARSQLRDARKLAVIGIAVQDVAVDLAKTRLTAAVVISPVDGVITYARAPGTAVMVGAPIVRIRPDGPSHIYTYLTTDQLAQVSVGSRASVTYDSNPGAPLAGRLTYLGDRAMVPPTNFPTSIVHMTRAVRVTIELDGDLTAPPGTPVDVEITAGL
jgi:multidrug resistance efflux pump